MANVSAAWGSAVWVAWRKTDPFAVRSRFFRPTTSFRERVRRRIRSRVVRCFVLASPDDSIARRPDPPGLNDEMGSLPMSAIKQVTIIGTGLIGGSLALALRHRGIRVIGSDKPRVLAKAEEIGAIDSGIENPARACVGSDVVILAANVGGHA